MASRDRHISDATVFRRDVIGVFAGSQRASEDSLASMAFDCPLRM